MSSHGWGARVGVSVARDDDWGKPIAKRRRRDEDSGWGANGDRDSGRDWIIDYYRRRDEQIKDSRTEWEAPYIDVV